MKTTSHRTGPSIRRLRWLALLAVLALLVAACGGEEDGETASGDSTPEQTSTEEPDAGEETDAGEPGAEEPEAEETAEPADDLFAGEDIRILVGFPPGGGADENARFIAEHLPNYLPGSPRVVVENLPGGGGAVSVHELVDSGSDGLDMVMITNGVIGRWLSGTEGHDYPLDEMSPVSTIAQSSVFLVRTDAAEDLEALQARSEPINVSGSAPGGGLHWGETLIAEALDIPMNHVFGYEGYGPQIIALESGEVHALTAPEPAYDTWAHLVDEGTAWPMVEAGVLDEDGEIVRSPGQPVPVPTLIELYEQEVGEPSPELAEELLFLAAVNSAGYPLYAAPDAQSDRLEAIKQGFRDMGEDPAFLEAMVEFFGGEYAYYGPEGIQSVMDQILTQTAALERILSRL